MTRPLIGMTVCSGIGAPECAAPWVDWRFQSEIDKFPCAVLASRFPHAVNLGDMTKFKEWPDANVNVLCGGTPCQSFSVAGLRKGLADPRGNLMLTYLAIADRYRPKWLVWENVPGVLSSNGGRDFGTFLGGLAELGYGFAFRVLDAQYVRVESHPWAVPQRRRRVFVVGCLGDWRRPAAVLFERESLSGHPAPRREAGKGTARGFETGPSGGSFTDLAPTMDARAKDGPIRNQLGVGVITSTGKVRLRNPGMGVTEGVAPTVDSGQPHAVAHPMTLAIRGRGDSHDLEYRQDGTANAVLTPNGGRAGMGVGAIAHNWAVRRLTPLECERLQGFPDGWTDIAYRGKPAADGPRYKALGNSMAVNVMTWIFERIRNVEGLM